MFFYLQPHFQCHQSHNIIKADTLVFGNFLECLLLFLVYNVDKKSEQFSKSESSASGCFLDFVYFFCQFQPGAVYKSVAYKKSVYVRLQS